MNNFSKIDIKDVAENAIKLISERWMLVTAGNKDSFNTMTASWGTMGFLWGKPVVYVFIRPQRYTFEFMEKNTEFTLSFFPDENKEALNICGSTSGRDCNKVEKAGISPIETENGNITFNEANLVLECKTLYKEDFKAENFLDKELIQKWFAAGDYHKVYVAEIVNTYKR